MGTKVVPNINKLKSFKCIKLNTTSKVAIDLMDNLLQNEPVRNNLIELELIKIGRKRERDEILDKYVWKHFDQQHYNTIINQFIQTQPVN